VQRTRHRRWSLGHLGALGVLGRRHLANVEPFVEIGGVDELSHVWRVDWRLGGRSEGREASDGGLMGKGDGRARFQEAGRRREGNGKKSRIASASHARVLVARPEAGAAAKYPRLVR